MANNALKKLVSIIVTIILLGLATVIVLNVVAPSVMIAIEKEVFGRIPVIGQYIDLNGDGVTGNDNEAEGTGAKHKDKLNPDNPFIR